MINVSVLLLFHARPDHFARVWAEVRRAQPARLFLYQDGPRPDGRDDQGIAACRRLVADEEITWPCEVHRNYQAHNAGCDPSGFLSQQWAFSLTDKCIVLEDDVVPSQSFFPFCKELLDRYEDDPRVTMIAGFNTDRPQPVSSSSYFFTRVFSIWGWASWARVIRERDASYGFVHERKQWALLQRQAARYHQRREMLCLCQTHAATGRPYFETIFWAYMMLHDGLAIMPRLNLINNIGLDGGTHYSTELELLPRRLRWQFVMPRHELTFPLQHPEAVVEDPAYQRRHYLLNAWDNPLRKLQYSLEELYLNLRHGNLRRIMQAVRARIKKGI